MKCKHWLFLLFLFGGCSAQIASYFCYPVGDENGNGWLNTFNQDGGGLNWLEEHAYGCGLVYHPGLDLNWDDGWDCGKDVYAIADGKVVYRKDARGALIIVHYLPNGDSAYSSFLHLQNIYVDTVGSARYVRKGVLIGKVGDVGAPGACHIHFETPQGWLSEQDGSGRRYPSDYFPCNKDINFVKNHYNNTWFFIPYNRFSVSNNYKFANHSAEGWSHGNHTGFAEQNQQNSNGWRVHVTGDNPGIVSPQFSEGILAAGAVAHFSMKVENADPIFSSLYGKVVCGKVWVKDETGSWNNPVDIELANEDYHYDPNSNGNYSEYNSGQFNFYRANFSSLRKDLLIKQFSIELTDGYGVGNIYWQIDSLKIFERRSFVYINSTVCNNYHSDATDDQLKTPLFIHDDHSKFYKGENVCCLTELRNVFIDHRFKVRAYTNGVFAWEWVDGWQPASERWFYPFWYDVPAGNNEFRIYVDIVRNNNDMIDDWELLDTKTFITEGTVSIASSENGSGGGVYEPGNLTVNSVDASSVMLVWDMGLNSSSDLTYYIYRSPNESFSSAIKIDSTINTYYRDDGLVEGEGFNYWVRASIGGQLSDCSNSVYAITSASHGDGSFPTAPTNLSCVFTSSSSVRVSWSPGSNTPSNIMEYHLYKATCNYPEYAHVCAITPYTSQEVVGLSHDTTYYFWVDITTKDNYGSQFSVSTSIVMSTYIYPPDSFRVVDVKIDSVNLAWEKSLGAIQRYWVSRYSNGVEDWSVSTTDTFFVDRSVMAEKIYSYKVRANSTIFSDFSPEVVANVPPKQKNYFDFVFLPDADSNSYAEVAYLYQKGNDSAMVSILDLGSERVLQSFSFKNCSPNSLADVRVDGNLKLVIALDSLIYGDTLVTLFKVIDAGLNSQTFVFSAPVNFQAGLSSLGQISLNWGYGNNSVGSGVQYCLYAGQTNDSSLAQFVGSTIGTNYVHTGLNPGSNWYYWLKSVVGLEASSLVGPVQASTNQLSAPTNFVVDQVAGSQVILGWSSVAGVDGYRMYRDGLDVGSTMANSFVDASVGPQVEYFYQVASVFGNYVSPPTDALSVFTPYNYLTNVYSIKDVKDAEFLPDLDGDGLPEVASLGVDSTTNAPMVVVKNSNNGQVLAFIPFFSDSTIPLYFSPTYLSGDYQPSFTVMGMVADSVKMETRSFLGTKLSY